MIKQVKLGAISGNVYLIKNDHSFVLIDTGLKSKRNALVKGLEELGCEKGMLKCILLTHGDFDHSGNARYLAEKFNCPIGIHKGDAIVLEKGDMFINRKNKNRLVSFMVKRVMGIEPFVPNFYLEDLHKLNEYGIDAFLLHTPGHSPGSISIITSEKDCICGDLLENIKKPQINTMVDDALEVQSSVNKVLKYDIKSFYPGHGNVFDSNQLI